MIWILAIAIVLALVYGPSLWVRSVLARYSEPANRYPGTGGELARHLLDGLGMQGVKVEKTEHGDHYDPLQRAVRLTPDKFAGRSLTAVTVAAHEVGHAVQDQTGYAPLRWRTRLARLAMPVEKLGAGILMLAPVIALVTRAVPAALLFGLGGMLTLGASIVVHLVTLPTEFDASFNRALPILDRGGYLKDGDEPHARRLLTAAALTYVSASLMSLLNAARWWAILRR